LLGRAAVQMWNRLATDNIGQHETGCIAGTLQRGAQCIERVAEAECGLSDFRILAPFLHSLRALVCQCIDFLVVFAVLVGREQLRGVVLQGFESLLF